MLGVLKAGAVTVVGNPVIVVSCVGVAVVVWRMGCTSSKEVDSPPVASAAPKNAEKPVEVPKPEPMRPKVTVTETDRVVLQLRSTKDDLGRLKKRSEISMEKDKEVAKKLLAAGKKEQALLAMKKCRLSQNSLNSAETMIHKVEEQLATVETAQMHKDMFEALDQGNAAIKKLEESMKIEDIERMLDETEDHAEKAREIDYLLRANGQEDDVLEDEAEEELQALMASLEKEKAAAALEAAPEVPSEPLPEAPVEETEAPSKAQEPAAEAPLAA